MPSRVARPCHSVGEFNKVCHALLTRERDKSVDKSRRFRIRTITRSGGRRQSGSERARRRVRNCVDREGESAL
jgi:hypothetical protein